MRRSEIYLDVRPRGYGVVFNGAIEVWEVDLDTCIAKLRGLVSQLKSSDRGWLQMSIPSPFPRHHIRVAGEDGRGFGVHLGYWLDDGTAAFGGTSALWPSDVDELLTRVRSLLELMRSDASIKEIPLDSIGLPGWTW